MVTARECGRRIKNTAMYPLKLRDKTMETR